MSSDYYIVFILLSWFVLGVIALSIISRKKSIQEKNKSQSKDSFYSGSYNLSVLMAGIGHELSSPLTAIGGFLSHLNNRIKSGDANKDEIIHKINICLEQAYVMMQLINDFRNIGRIQKQKNFVPVRMNKLINDVVQTFIPAYPHIDFILELDNFEPVRLIPNQIMLALSNIIKNSTEAIGANKEGFIKISLTRIQNTNIDFDIYLDVLDNGGGIKNIPAWRVFQPFISSGKKKGTGLGLTFCKQIAENHDGNIEIIKHDKNETLIRLIIPHRF